MPVTNSAWKTYTWTSLSGLIAITVFAAWTQTWVLFAVPVGFLFGFFLQKGDLCGSSAFSEILVMRDRRKIAGLWVLIVVAMLGFAFLDLMGWIVLNPKPFLYWNYIVGGLVFGVGMVLAGGCVSGCLYKAATGNINSIAALLTIPVGVMLVEFGPLKPLQQVMKSGVLSAPGGERLSLQSISPFPFYVWAIIFAVPTLLIGIRKLSKSGSSQSRRAECESGLERVVRRPWKPWQAGVAIGLLMIPAYLSSAASGRNYPLGVTHGVMQAELLLIDNDFNHVYQANPTQTVKGSGKKVVWWLIFLVAALIIGSWVSARISGQAKLLRKPPDEILFALLGGMLVGVGAAIATGCVVGNIMSGWALLSVGAVLFGLVTILSNWVATYYYLMGGSLGK